MAASGAPSVINEIGRTWRAPAGSGYYFLPHRSRSNGHRHAASSSSPFRFRRRPVILVAWPAHAARVNTPTMPNPGTIVIQSGNAASSQHRKDQARKYRSASAVPASNGLASARIASKHIKPAWKPPASLRGSARRTYIGARRKSDGRRGAGCWSTANSPSTAPTILARSAAWCPRAASHAQQRHHGYTAVSKSVRELLF